MGYSLEVSCVSCGKQKVDCDSFIIHFPEAFKTVFLFVIQRLTQSLAQMRVCNPLIIEVKWLLNFCFRKVVLFVKGCIN